MYGGEIADSSILSAHDRVLSHFFTPLVREKHQRGLAWLDEFAQENPSFIRSVDAEHTAQDFTNRLQGLVDNPIEFLLCVKVIVAVENDAYPVAQQKLMDGHGPVRAVLLETVRAVRILAAPFMKRCDFHAAAALMIQATHQVMNEHELEFGPAVFECPLEPAVLSAAERRTPVVSLAT